MPSPKARSRLARLHRWLALLLAPVFLIILVTGGILAFRPILAGRTPIGTSTSPTKVDVVSGLLSWWRRASTRRLARVAVALAESRSPETANIT